jgi:hypothetical protein
VIDKLVAFLGEEPHTPLDVALEETLRGLGSNKQSPSVVQLGMSKPSSPARR